MTTSDRQRWFPRLQDNDYRETSPIDEAYNCIAHVADRNDIPWWPIEDEDYYWPLGCPRDGTLDTFIKAFRLERYEICESGQLEDGYEKIVFYVDAAGMPKHGAKQLPSGTWTSKIGFNIDIEHFSLEGLEDGIYGRVGLFMKRPRQQEAPDEETT